MTDDQLIRDACKIIGYKLGPPNEPTPNVGSPLRRWTGSLLETWICRFMCGRIVLGLPPARRKADSLRIGAAKPESKR